MGSGRRCEAGEATKSSLEKSKQGRLRKGEKELQAAGRTPNTSETSMGITTIKVLVDDIVNYGAPEAMLFLVLLVINPLELFEVVLDASIEIRCLRVPGMINTLQYRFHSRSNNIRKRDLGV
jgi:hypothetical protein